MVREEYIGTYEDKVAATKGVTNESTKASHIGGVDEFANISINLTKSTRLSEIDEYLRLPVENVSDPLKWWYDHRRVYPNLSRMALDYLSIPGKIHYHVSSFYAKILPKQHQRLSNVSSQKVVIYFTSPETAFLHHLSVPTCALVHGLATAFSPLMTF